MAGGYLQIDETPIRYLSPGHGQTKLGYFWTALSPGGDVVYHWETSRGADCLKNVIAADFQGTLQCDAYVAYGSFVKKHKHNITLAGCWAHARRNFYEAREQAPQRCGWILRQIGHLYRIEENLRCTKAGSRKRAAVRMSQSRPICQRLYRALVLFKKSRRYLPRSAFGQAIDYALSNWPLLGVYLDDGRIQIDNNLVENSIRPTALGKKNWLFFGDAMLLFNGNRGIVRTITVIVAPMTPTVELLELCQYGSWRDAYGRIARSVDNDDNARWLASYITGTCVIVDGGMTVKTL
jgi:transposase